MITGESLAAATRMSGYSPGRVVVVSAGILLLVTLAALIGPFVTPHDYQSTELENVLQPPS